MNIKEFIKAGKMESNMAAEEIKMVSAVDVGFIGKDGQQDETELTVENHILTDAGVEELSDLFDSLAEELEADKDKITHIFVVASADTQKELEAMGY